MKKKLLSALMAFAMVLTLLPTAFAANGDFAIENGILTHYYGSGGDVKIPDGVTAIGENVFCWSDSRDSLTSVTIPDSVTFIREGAFLGCDSLTDVYFSGSKDQWEEITIGAANNGLVSATIHFGSSGPDDAQESEKEPINFTDVKPTAYYYDAVQWALENAITDGTSTTTFSPDKTCTRGQIVTFLYRDLVQSN